MRTMFLAVIACCVSTSSFASRVICHERDAATHISRRLIEDGAAAAERTYHLIRGISNSGDTASLVAHLKPRPLHRCECTDPSMRTTASRVLMKGDTGIGAVVEELQSLPHPLYSAWRYERTVYAVSGSELLCNPLTN